MIETLTRRFEGTTGLELAWDRWGASGTPLVLVHGFSGSAHDFALQIQPLTARVPVATLDNRGHGLSDKPDDPDAYSLEALTADLEVFVEDVVGGPVDLLGHSMGGRLALELALERPDLLRSLILMDTTADAFGPDDDELLDLVLAYFEGVSSEQFTAMEMPGPEAELIERTTTSKWRTVKADRSAAFALAAARGLGRQLFSRDLRSLVPRLGEFDFPVTVLVGSEDHPFVDHAPAMVEAVVDGELVVIEGAFHSPQLTHPEVWRGAVLAHLDRLE